MLSVLLSSSCCPSAGVAMATTAQVLSISFVSDTGTSNEHTLYVNGATDDGWSDSANSISDPVWQNGGATNFPACYDRSTATVTRSPSDREESL